VQVLPLCTPLRRDGGAAVRTERIFFGGINVYLQQVSDLFRRMPAAVARWLDHPALLNWVARFAISTDPVKLGAMTVSMLAGREGRQAREAEALLDFLAADPPELVVITNALLSGLAPAVKSRLAVPVVCLLQGEEIFLDAMPAPYRAQAVERIRANAGAVDLFIATYAAYAEEMAGFLAVPPERLAVIHPGIDLSAQVLAARPPAPFTVGYLSVITPGKGLDLLVEAVGRLSAAGRDVRLCVAGAPRNPGYWRAVRRGIATGLTGRVEVLGEIDHHAKQAFFRRISAFVLPSRFRAARGMAALEAQAAGVPVVVPAAGIFPEMLALTRGGILVPPDDAAALAAALARLQDDPAAAAAYARQAAAGVARHFAAPRIAEQIQQVFTNLLHPEPAEEMPLLPGEDDVDDEVEVEE